MKNETLTTLFPIALGFSVSLFAFSNCGQTFTADSGALTGSLRLSSSDGQVSQNILIDGENKVLHSRVDTLHINYTMDLIEASGYVCIAGASIENEDIRVSLHRRYRHDVGGPGYETKMIQSDSFEMVGAYGGTVHQDCVGLARRFWFRVNLDRLENDKFDQRMGGPNNAKDRIFAQVHIPGLSEPIPLRGAVAAFGGVGTGYHRVTDGDNPGYIYVWYENLEPIYGSLKFHWRDVEIKSCEIYDLTRLRAVTDVTESQLVSHRVEDAPCPGYISQMAATESGSESDQNSTVGGGPSQSVLQEWWDNMGSSTDGSGSGESAVTESNEDIAGSSETTESCASGDCNNVSACGYDTGDINDPRRYDGHYVQTFESNVDSTVANVSGVRTYQIINGKMCINRSREMDPNRCYEEIPSKLFRFKRELRSEDVSYFTDDFRVYAARLQGLSVANDSEVTRQDTEFTGLPCDNDDFGAGVVSSDNNSATNNQSLETMEPEELSIDNRADGHYLSFDGTRTFIVVNSMACENINDPSTSRDRTYNQLSQGQMEAFIQYFFTEGRSFSGDPCD